MQLLQDGRLQIVDTRHCALQRVIHLSGLEKAILLICDAVTPCRQLPRLLHQQGLDVSPADVLSAWVRLVDSLLLICIQDKLLSLPVSGELPSLPDDLDFPGGAVDPRAMDHCDPASEPLRLRFRESR